MKTRINTFVAIALPAAYAAWLAYGGPGGAAKRGLDENQPVELLTFIFLLAAAVVAARVTRRAHRAGAPARVWGFYAAFAITAFVVAAEEVAWGQWFVRFETPEFFLEHNRQRMVTLHNLPGIDARSEFIRVGFGLAGLIGCMLARRAFWRPIAPGAPLVPWFASIFVFASVDFLNDFVALQPTFDFVINAISELIEMMIGVAAVLYVALNSAALPNITHPVGRKGETTKRIFDVVAASAALVVLAPLLLLIAACVAVRLGRPVLFSQQRPGRYGKPFCLWKFRTMTDARNADGRLLPDAQRLTRFGHFLRKTSLDELPELWNVLRGEMSLVGPRPLLVDYLPLYSEEQMRRHEVLPGITGWAQINGRNAASWPRKFALDVWYVDHQSLWLDLKIIARKLLIVVSREGVDQPGGFGSERFRGEVEDAPARREQLA